MHLWRNVFREYRLRSRRMARDNLKYAIDTTDRQIANYVKDWVTNYDIFPSNKAIARKYGITIKGAYVRVRRIIYSGLLKDLP